MRKFKVAHYRGGDPEGDRETLRGWVKSTGGLHVGSAGVYSDNTGAIAL